MLELDTACQTSFRHCGMLEGGLAKYDKVWHSPLLWILTLVLNLTLHVPLNLYVRRH